MTPEDRLLLKLYLTARGATYHVVPHAGIDEGLFGALIRDGLVVDEARGVMLSASGIEWGKRIYDKLIRLFNQRLIDGNV